jgi:hypothetical protein
MKGKWKDKLEMEREEGNLCDGKTEPTVKAIHTFI